MQTFLIYFISSLINIIAIVYIQKSMLNKKFNFNNYRNYLVIIIMAIFLSISWIYISGFVRFLVATLLMSLMCFMLFDEKFHRSFIIGIIHQMLFFLAELIFSLIILILKIDILAIVNNTDLLMIIMNIIIAFIALAIYKFKYSNLVIKKLLKFVDNLTGAVIYSVMLVFILTLNILLMSIYFNSINKYVIIINIAFMFIYAGIIYLLINEKNENVKFRTENKMLLDNLNEYEKMLDYQRVNNHENKNQLLVIKGLIHKNNKNALDYINEIISEQREDNEKLFEQTKRIPSGGLQGLVYQKLISMQENGLKVYLDISSSVRKLKLSNLSTKLNYDICRIVGILLDNAQEESIKTKKKEIYIYMKYENKTFTIEISNYFEGVLSINEINNPGYTTKGKGHGYGLSLLNKIIKENHNIENENRITKDIFTQVIKIKM